MSILLPQSGIAPSALSPDVLDRMVQSGQLSPALAMQMAAPAQLAPNAPIVNPLNAAPSGVQQLAAQDDLMSRMAAAQKQAKRDTDGIDMLNATPTEKQRAGIIAVANTGKQFELADPRLPTSAPDASSVVEPGQVKTINPGAQQTDQAMRTPQGLRQLEQLSGIRPGGLAQVASTIDSVFAGAGSRQKTLQGKLSTATQNLETAIAGPAQTAERRATDELAIIGQKQRDQADYDTKFQGVMDTFLADRAESKAQRDTARADLRALGEVDPNRLLGKSGLGTQILAVMLAGIGGAAAGMGGGPNLVLEAIDDAIKNDIQKQISKRDGLRQIIADYQSDMGEAAEDADIATAALDHARENKLTGAALTLEEIAVKYRGTELGDQAKIASAQVHAQAAQQAVENDLKASDRDIQKFGMKLQAKMHEQSMQASQAKLLYDMQKDARGRAVEGLVGGQDATPDDVKGVKEQKTMVDNIVAKANEMKALRQKNGVEYWSDVDSNRAAQLAREIQLTLANDKYKLGALSKSDLEIVDDIIGSDPSRIGFVVNQLDGVIKSVQGDFSTFANNHGGYRATADSWNPISQPGKNQ